MGLLDVKGGKGSKISTEKLRNYLLNGCPETKNTTMIFPKAKAKTKHNHTSISLVSNSATTSSKKGALKKPGSFLLHTSVAIGNENTRPSKQLIKVKDDSKCRKWSGRMAIKWG